MTITIENSQRVKVNDVGDVYKITFSDTPPEFTFIEGTTKCKFIAKHKTDSTGDFSGECVVNAAGKSAAYTTAAGNNSVLGAYNFEFEFYTDPASYIQTYPKTSALSYTVIEDLN